MRFYHHTLPRAGAALLICLLFVIAAGLLSEHFYPAGGAASLESQTDFDEFTKQSERTAPDSTLRVVLALLRALPVVVFVDRRWSPWLESKLPDPTWDMTPEQAAKLRAMSETTANPKPPPEA